MENAVDALKMAASVLIFIIAIGASFSLFGTAKQTADSIVLIGDRQAYLEAAELDNGILYTSSSAILGDVSGKTPEEIEALKVDSSSIGGLTKNGDRIVKIDDIISTIYRYSKEKYGVTIVKKDGTVIARFDSNTENVMRQYKNITSGLDTYEKTLETNTKTIYAEPKFEDQFKRLYKVNVNDVGAPWYGNEEEIQKRISYDICGGTYTCNGQTYEGKELLNELNGKTVVEVTNEIDQSKYLEDSGNTTNLLQQYKMPTVEIVYIILE